MCRASLLEQSRSVQDARRQIYTAVSVAGEVALPAHCINCGMLQGHHAGADAKCLFDVTFFFPCNISLPEETISALKSRQLIPAIKAYRAATNCGLAHAKRLVELEAAYHGW